MQRVIIRRSTMDAADDLTEELLAPCLDVRELCRLLHRRGHANLADRLTRDLGPEDAFHLAGSLRRVAEDGRRAGFFRDYRTLLSEDDADEIWAAVTWLKRVARAGCRTWVEMHYDPDPPIRPPDGAGRVIQLRSDVSLSR